MNNDEVFYSLNIEDIQTTAQEILGRDLTPDEIKLAINRIPDYIDWYDAAEFAFRDLDFLEAGSDMDDD